MTNPEGTPVWYELMTTEAAAAKRFYDPLLGWTIGETSAAAATDYRMIESGDGQAGGVMVLTADMIAGGAKPGWLFYVGVDDVDAKAEQARALGASVIVPPSDIPDVGRFAFLADPQGAPFYIMRGASDRASRAFAPEVPGRCGWNELWTSDAAAALAFYTALFGWENRETMEMGPMGDYHFLDLGEVRLGALMAAPDRAPQWNFYFTVSDIHAAAARVEEGGGTIVNGPHEVPGGSVIVIAADPEGATVSLVAPAVAA